MDFVSMSVRPSVCLSVCIISCLGYELLMHWWIII